MDLAKTLITVGLVLVGIGILVWLSPRVPGLDKLGKLPRDVRIEGKNGSFYFPWVTCLLLSLILTVVLRLFRR